MSREIFFSCFAAAMLALALNHGFTWVVLQIMKLRHARKMADLDALYARAVECMQAGNQEAAEGFAARFKAKAGRPMPPILLVAREEEDGP